MSITDPGQQRQLLARHPRSDTCIPFGPRVRPAGTRRSAPQVQMRGVGMLPVGRASSSDTNGVGAGPAILGVVAHVPFGAPPRVKGGSYPGFCSKMPPMGDETR